MPQYLQADLVLLSFPFSGAAGTKKRPALIVRDTGDADVIVARVTSARAQSTWDVELTDWKQAGLLLASTVRTHKLATLEKSLIERRLGSLSPQDWQATLTKLRLLWM